MAMIPQNSTENRWIDFIAWFTKARHDPEQSFGQNISQEFNTYILCVECVVCVVPRVQQRKHNNEKKLGNVYWDTNEQDII